MNKLFIQFASLSGALAVGLGAFGAHALKDFLVASNRLDTFEKAVHYQFIHALALVLVAILQQFVQHKALNYAGYAFMAGSVIFSGALYLICFTGIKSFGAIAPIGGTAFIIGWICLFWAVK